ncbi:MAG: response regulator [Clostridia bacterium]|nr:response regulator [Clostridia bacterium]
MLIFAIDDEPIALAVLHNAIAEAVPVASIMDFPLGTDALEAIQKQGLRPDAVFSDIRMPQLDGLALAARIRSASPATKLVFVTAYSEYALKAIQLRASGYVMKPVDADAIREEIANIAVVRAVMPNGLWVRCFGNFEVFWNRSPLLFDRRQTKELFAFLIDREGGVCTSEEIIARLWESETNMAAAKDRLRHLVGDLRRTLSSIGMEDILVRRSGRLAILRDRVDCDFFRMVDGDMETVNTFTGEYMAQYSWAELTTGRLVFRIQKG